MLGDQDKMVKSSRSYGYCCLYAGFSIACNSYRTFAGSFESDPVYQCLSSIIGNQKCIKRQNLRRNMCFSRTEHNCTGIIGFNIIVNIICCNNRSHSGTCNYRICNTGDSEMIYNGCGDYRKRSRCCCG